MRNFLVFIGIALLSVNIIAADLDIGVIELDLGKYYSSEVEYIAVSGKVKNFGTLTINSFKINYQVDNGQIFEQSYSVALAPNGERTFIHLEPIEPVIGSHTIKVWTSMPNGNEDEVSSNDAITFSFIVYDILDFVPRTILVEAYTSSSCQPCVAGNAALKARLEENQGLYALIKYQMNWPGNGDPYFTLEGQTRRTYYGVNSVPYCFLEGPAWYGNSGDVTQPTLVRLQDVPAFLDLKVDYYVEGQTVRVKATMNSSYDMSGQNQRLYLAIVEKVTHLNRFTIPNQSNGETEFLQVMKKFMPDANGITFNNLNAKTPYTVYQEWEFKGDYRRPNNGLNPINHDIEHTVEDFDNLTIVAWIQNTQTRVVIQAANGFDTDNPTVVFSCVNSEFGAISATVNGEPVSSGNSVIHGNNVVFTASPENGYEVKEWRINGQLYTGENGNSIEIPANNYLTVTVEFREMPEYPCNTVGADASVEFNDDCTKATITWSAAEGEYTQAYRIMFNGDILKDNIQSTEYEHQFDFEFGKSYSWQIITICEYGDSDPRTVTATADCEYPCNTVGADASVEIDENCTKATIKWSAAEGEYTQAYRIMFNGNVLEDNIQTTEYVHNYNFEHDKTYNWEIITICEYGNSESRTVTIKANCNVGINRLLYNLTIYPNPASTSVIIKGAEIAKVEVYNMLGYLIDIKEGCIDAIDVYAYNQGQYIFKVYDINGYFVNKLVTIKK